MHVRAARRNGLSDDEIKEVLLQCAIYCGVPAANAGFAVAQRALAEEHDDDQGGDMAPVEPEQQPLLIGGEWTPAAGAATFERATRTRASASTLAAAGGRADADRAVDAAHAAFAAGPTPPPQSGARCSPPRPTS